MHGGEKARVVLPESVVEIIALQLALNVSASTGPLSAAPAIANMFQVCWTWRNISRSELLWETLCVAVWGVRSRHEGRTWYQEYLLVHVTSINLRTGNYRHYKLNYEISGDSNGRSEKCRCLALSGRFLAGGFSDGAIRVFDLKSRLCMCTMKPVHRDRFGPLSRAITGLVIDNEKVTFASLDGSVFVGNIVEALHRRVHVGNVIQDGALISFTGCSRWWVGLYAGSPGNSIRIWDAATREPVFQGGHIMDNDAMRGWNLFLEQATRIGSLRVSNDSYLVSTTQTKISVVDLETFGLRLNIEREEQIAVEAFDVKYNRLLTSSYDGDAQVRRLPHLQEQCRLQHVRAGSDSNHRTKIVGALNTRQAFLCISGVINAWDAVSGSHLYRVDEQLGSDVYDLVASDQFVAACVSDIGLHLWDFTPCV
ncbi:hypothetical protein O6H91_05G098600 [Diphasiastrum complanatum]|uniref:Uncharacterized protein n=1 Tax=Diphasiastrum complanatum TaxID=34168 RepID=A0ACC2DR94_DIPCM|nr:hypothetical protein O6H91_05G098600 [Diphasiastrum complanatum]